MRKHDVRKWIHAVLDMLPLFIIPIFAIYMRNENSTRDISIDYDFNKIVNFNQLVHNGNFENTDYWVAQGVTFSVTNNTGIVRSTSSSGALFSNPVSVVEGHKYLKSGWFKLSSVPNGSVWFRLFLGSTNSYDDTFLDSNNLNWQYIQTISTATGDFDASYLGLRDNSTSDFVDIYLRDFYLIDLTQMFGSGKEPSIEEFNAWYPNDYYAYNTGTKQLLNNYSTETYNNTDIGSQMMYSLYTPVKEYFNLNNVANFGSIYDWLQLNFFNGTAPMSVFIVWNIILYEFIMDILFLIYAVFMFIIDFVECLIDKAFGKSYRGGR